MDTAIHPVTSGQSYESSWDQKAGVEVYRGKTSITERTSYSCSSEEDFYFSIREFGEDIRKVCNTFKSIKKNVPIEPEDPKTISDLFKTFDRFCKNTKFISVEYAPDLSESNDKKRLDLWRWLNGNDVRDNDDYLF